MSQKTDHHTDAKGTADTTDTPILGREWDPTKTTRDRVYEVAIQLREPATTTDVAERADCSTDAARSHLDWLAEIGVVTRDPGHPTTYRRNESYFEWRRVKELRREYSREELLDRFEVLTEAERDYRERYEAAHPDDVDALDAADFDATDRDAADFDATDPDDVDFDATDRDAADFDATDRDAADFDAVHEVWRDLDDWRTVRGEMRLLERARRTSERN